MSVRSRPIHLDGKSTQVLWKMSVIRTVERDGFLFGVVQGFPDDFEFLGGRVPVAHQIGNAVPPPLARALGKAILEALRKRAAGVTAEVAGQMAFFL